MLRTLEEGEPAGDAGWSMVTLVMGAGRRGQLSAGQVGGGERKDQASWRKESSGRVYEVEGDEGDEGSRQGVWSPG